MVSVIYPWLRDRKREDPARCTYLDKSKGDANLKANPTGNKENSAKKGTDFLRGKEGWRRRHVRREGEIRQRLGGVIDRCKGRRGRRN